MHKITYSLIHKHSGHQFVYCILDCCSSCSTDLNNYKLRFFQDFLRESGNSLYFNTNKYTQNFVYQNCITFNNKRLKNII